jgi:UDP-N-acetylmuramate--alanine ligase
VSDRTSRVRGAAAIGRGLEPARTARAIHADEVIHVVGAAGAGASAAALLASAAGAHVSGCDRGGPSAYAAALLARGIDVAAVHDAAHVTSARPRPTRLAVTKALTSIDPDHAELAAARQAGIPVEPWQQVVADAAATQGGQLVAVAGTHGKSTSAGWLVHVLVGSGRDPAAFVGALLPPALSGGEPATARWGRGDVVVVEADEYAGNFDPYRPDIAIVLNAEWDHPDVFADESAVVAAFEAWLRASGEAARRAVLGVDGSGGRALAERLADWGDRVVTVGSGDDARVRYERDGPRLRLDGLASARGGGPDARLWTELLLGGRHNAGNAACVAAAAALLGVPGASIGLGLRSFAGVSRRLEVRGEVDGVLVVDDYGHHPTAIRATLAALRERYPGRPVWLAHEPLTYHRAAAMRDELAAALAEADHVVIADIWAGRDPDTSITSALDLASAVARLAAADVAAPGSVEDTADFLAQRVRRGDVVLAMGGGRAYVIADRLLGLLGAGASV